MTANCQHYLFPPPAPVSIEVQGSALRFPVYRVFCVGRNFEAHAAEMQATVERTEPFFFTKSPSAVVPSGATIPYPPGTGDFHHEMELVVALAGAGFRLDAAAAAALIYGYACGLDMTRRDLQQAARHKGYPWDLGKDVEASAIVSPIVPRERTGLIDAGRIELRVNGKVRQSADLSQMVVKVADLIAYLSRFYHLRSGDLLFTGTPAGIAAVVPGDVLEGSVEGVGSLRVTIGDRED
jgi:fumarylpyruvate hydrolase